MEKMLIGFFQDTSFKNPPVFRYVAGTTAISPVITVTAAVFSVTAAIFLLKRR